MKVGVNIIEDFVYGVGCGALMSETELVVGDYFDFIGIEFEGSVNDHFKYFATADRSVATGIGGGLVFF